MAPLSPTKSGGKKRAARTKLFKRLGFGEEAFLIMLACIIGSLTGVGSVAFTFLIEAAHTFCYGHDNNGGLYNAQKYMLILLPAIGALAVGFITYYFAREAKGHGVPEVMDAIASRDGVIRPRVAIAKAISSALTIGSGGSAGTEGPIIQIGAVIGSSAGRYFQVVKHNMPVLVGCGAAAGISAIFHAPIAGVLFALEIFLRELNFKTFSPIMIASVISSVTTTAILGEDNAIFPMIHTISGESVLSYQWYEMGNYLVLGIICAIAAVAFIRLLYKFEDTFDELTQVHYILKPVIGAIGLGLIGLFSVVFFSGANGSPLFGNGYGVIAQCIGSIGEAEMTTLSLGFGSLIVLFVLKLLATCCTLGSGGSGGIFAPSLFLGAVIGYAFGVALQNIGIFGDTLTPQSYALVGMAAVVAGTTHAPMAAVIILFEMTRDYRVILPAMLASTIALSIAHFMHRDSIYTKKLRRRGVQYESRANTAVLRRLTVKMVMQSKYYEINDNTPLDEVIRISKNFEVNDFILTDGQGHYHGILATEDIHTALLEPEALPLLLASELAHTEIPMVSPEETLDKVLDIFSKFDVNSLAVHAEGDEHKFIGMITRAALMRRHQQAL